MIQGAALPQNIQNVTQVQYIHGYGNPAQQPLPSAPQQSQGLRECSPIILLQSALEVGAPDELFHRCLTGPQAAQLACSRVQSWGGGRHCLPRARPGASSTQQKGAQLNPPLPTWGPTCTKGWQMLPTVLPQSASAREWGSPGSPLPSRKPPLSVSQTSP